MPLRPTPPSLRPHNPAPFFIPPHAPSSHSLYLRFLSPAQPPFFLTLHNPNKGDGPHLA